jgi:hypothetical protein
MKIKGILFTIIVFTGLVCYAQDEPALKIKVTMEGNVQYVDDGDTITIADKPVIIETAAVKTFQLSSLQFDYPRDFGFHHEAESAFKNWTFDGNDFVIMIFEFPQDVQLDVFTKEMVRKFGKKNCKITARKVQLKNMELKGKRIDVRLLGSRLTYDLFPLPIVDEKTHVITFQDTKSDSGGDSAEGIETMKLIAQTMKVVD